MLPRYDLVPGVRKIAVLRANGLGDFLVTLPALEALRAAYPSAELVLLAREWQRALLSGRPGPVDRVIAVPVSHGVREEPEAVEDPVVLERFFAAMRDERFDLALQMHGGGRNSNPFVLRLGARVTVGARTPDAVPLDRSVPYVFFQHEILRHLEEVSLAGATVVTLEPRLSVTAADLAEACRAVHDADSPLVALHPGAGDPRRWWPAERFAAVGDALAAAGARVVVVGAGIEHGVTTAVVDGMRAPALNLCDRLSLGGLAGLLSRCALVVSNDSGPGHLAEAVGTPTVRIFWCFNLVNWGPLTRTRHRPLTSWRLACPVCGHDCTIAPCDHLVSYVADVPTEQVIAAALDLLATAATRHEPPRALAAGAAS